jgi:hypothetical protein
VKDKQNKDKMPFLSDSNCRGCFHHKRGIRETPSTNFTTQVENAYAPDLILQPIHIDVSLNFRLKEKIAVAKVPIF